MCISIDSPEIYNPILAVASKRVTLTCGYHVHNIDEDDDDSDPVEEQSLSFTEEECPSPKIPQVEHN